MNPTETDTAAGILIHAAANRERLTELPAGLAPCSVEEAHAIQQRVVDLSCEPLAGWKVATGADGTVTWGAIYRRDCFTTPAVIEPAHVPLLGIEGEIAFRFRRDLPTRSTLYTQAEIKAALAPFPAIEIVNSRFASYRDTPVLHRLADRMSNGALVCGAAEPGVEKIDLSQLRVRLLCDGAVLVDRTGGHAKGDPLGPVVDFIHARQSTMSYSAGQIITAGTLTGLTFGQPGQNFDLIFDGFGSVSLSIGN